MIFILIDRPLFQDNLVTCTCDASKEAYGFAAYVVRLVGFYGISTFVGYLTPNPFLCKSVLFKTIQFSISTD